MNSSWLKNSTLAERLWQIALGLGTMLFTFVFVYVVFVLPPTLQGGGVPMEISSWSVGEFYFLLALSIVSILGYGWASWSIGCLSALLGLRVAWITMGDPFFFGSSPVIGIGMVGMLFTPLVVLLILRRSRLVQEREQVSHFIS